jgi:hypothetical protein
MSPSGTIYIVATDFNPLICDETIVAMDDLVTATERQRAKIHLSN